MQAGVSRTAAIGIGLAIVFAVGILVVWGLGPGNRPSIPAGLTEVKDADEIKNLATIDRVGILTSTNYLGHKVYVVQGTLKNVSPKPLRLVDVKLSFVDSSKKLIHEEAHLAFELKQRPLEPGTEYRFEINFENPPKTWNYHVPDTQIVRVAY